MANLKLQTSRAAAVTPSDTVDIAYPGDATAAPNTAKWPCVLYVGGAGDVKVKTASGDEVTFVGIAAGTFMPVNVVRVFSTGTSATNILALW
jgi:hypothetical protein